MTALTLAVVMQVSLAAPTDAHAMRGAQTYAAAYQQSKEEGQPLLVLVGADWCPACQQMKQSVMPRAAQQGVLDRVAFAQVNTDHEPTIARQIMRGGSIPQLVLYRKTSDGWQLSRRWVGAQSVETIRSAVDGALAAQEEGKSNTQLTQTASGN
ncbi:MAG: thioredoxin family protein [Pirellulales bacterium]|nr:thioredoxin family protein [Pirellulales bacterium]